MKFLLFILLFSAIGVQAQLTFVDTTQTPEDLVLNGFLGTGIVSISNITFNGGPGSVWTEQAVEFNSANANVGILSGIVLATGDAGVAMGPNNNGAASLGGGVISSPGPCDVDVQALDPFLSAFHDCATLEFDFVPAGDTMLFDFVFASEEYLEFVNQINDVAGVFVSGPGISGPYSNNSENIFLVPGTAVPVGVSTVNDVFNSVYYVDNGDGFTAPHNTDPSYVQYDGFTTVITAHSVVQQGESYHIKIVIADAADTSWDSAIFLKAGSFRSAGGIATSILGSVNDLRFSVNTVEHQLNVSGASDINELSVELLGSDGRLLQALQPLGNGAFSYSNNLPAGVYLLKISNGQGLGTLRFVQ